VRPPRSKSLIYDIYGAYVRPTGGWIAVADLITLMGELGADEQAVRSSVSRMSRKGMLMRRRRAGQIGYELSPEAEEILKQGDLAIFTGMQPAKLEDGWVLTVFSIPEEERGKRHQLRSNLAWLGYGNLGGGVWLAPRRVSDGTVDVIRRLGLEEYVDVFTADYRGFDDLRRLVSRCWDLQALNSMYADFVGLSRAVLRRWKRPGHKGTDRRAFIDFTCVLHQWRKMPFLDPGLPPELLPRGWQGTIAAELFAAILDRLEKRACRYVESVTKGLDLDAAADAERLPRDAARGRG
jgi:phenylacetic acid degradation operon negative regulatory protein